MNRRSKQLAGIVFVLSVSACQPVTPPVAPPPVVVAPPPPPLRPYPPGGAASSTIIPALGFDGVRMTPNRNLSRDEHIWNFRVALNVAALTCRSVIWDEIADNYNQMLKTHKTALNRINTAVEAQYKKENGTGSARIRDTASTELFNYFSLPPVRSAFCNAALQKSREVLTLTPDIFPEYSIGSLDDLDRIFIDFFDAYAQYEIDLAAWQAQYGPPIRSTSIFESGSGATNVYSPSASGVTFTPDTSPAATTITTVPVPASTPPVEEEEADEVIFAPGNGTPTNDAPATGAATGPGLKR